MKELKEKIEEKIKTLTEEGLDNCDIDLLGKMVDIHKDIEQEEYHCEKIKLKKEANNMRYEGYGEYGEGYGRRRRDSRGRYMESGYNEGGYNEGGYNEGGYSGGRGSGRGGGRGRGRGSYGHYMPYPPEIYMDRMMEGMEGYMEGREQYNRGNYGAKGESVESLEKMLEGIVAFVEDIQQDPEQKEEKEVVNHYIKKLKEM